MNYKIEFEKFIERNECPICNSSNYQRWDFESTNDINSLECSNCSMVFMNKILPDNEKENFYKGYNVSRNEDNIKVANQRTKMYQLDYNYLSNLLGKDGNFLDIGCGQGDFLALFNDKIIKYGFEIDQAAIEFGNKKHSNINFYNNYDDIRRQNIKFNSIIFRGSFQYITNILPIIDFCHEFLIEDGNLCILSLPNSKSPLALLQRENWSMSNKLEHVNLYNLSVIDFLFKNKFQIIDFHFPYIGTPYENNQVDLDNFVRLCSGDESVKQLKFPFWGSLINLIAKKI